MVQKEHYRLKWFLLKIRFHGDIRKISDSTRSQTLSRLTLRGILPGPIFSLQASPCFDREN